MNSDTAANPPPLLPAFTLSLCLFCLAVGISGLEIGYPQPQPPALDVPPTQAQLVKIEVVKPVALRTEPPPQAAAPPDTPVPAPAAPPPPVIPEAPKIIPVAAPSPAIAFAVPMEGLTMVVDPELASHGAGGDQIVALSALSGKPGGNASPAVAPPATRPQPPSVMHLVYGQGEGNQPPPDYPQEAALEHQEGTVMLRFGVDSAGRVGSVQVVSPSPWPLLNQAAQRAVRDTWHFSPGAPRIFDVPIQFQLGE